MTPDALAEIIFNEWPRQVVGNRPPKTWAQCEADGSSDYYHRVARAVLAHLERERPERHGCSMCGWSGAPYYVLCPRHFADLAAREGAK